MSKFENIGNLDLNIMDIPFAVIAMLLVIDLVKLKNCQRH